MIPRTFLSTYAFNNQQQMAVVFLTDITGLKRWADYIPVKLEQGGSENSYANNGYVDVVSVVKTSTMRPFAEYVPVYVDNSASDAWQINATGYIPYGFAGFGDASMVMDFTNGAALDPRITFSRTSNATLTNSAGVIAYAPHNLLTYSEQFDNAQWVKGASCVVTANAATAPDGTSTADFVVSSGATAGANTIRNLQTTADPNGSTYVFSVWLRADAPTTTTIRCANAADGDGSQQTVNVGTTWERFSVSRTFTATSTGVRGAINYQSSAVSVYAWGAQLNVGALQPYYTTTVKNLLGYTQEFGTVAWVKTRSSISSDVAIDPQGYMTADKLIENTDNSTHFVRQSPSLNASAPHTVSVYLKADERTEAIIRLFSSGGWAATSSILVNLLTGSVVVAGSGATGSATDVGNGWYRVAITQSTNATTGAKNVDIFPALNGTDSYQGDGTSGIFIWGAQLSDSASLDPYVYNPVAAPAAAAYYGPRFDYDPVTLAPKGLLIEEQRTNLLLQSEDFTTTWSTSGTNATVTANTAVSPDGTQDGDTLTDNSTSGIHRVGQSTSALTATTKYSVSLYAKYSTLRWITLSLSSGTFSWAGAKFDVENGILGNLSQEGSGWTADSASITAVGNGWYRCVVNVTCGTSATGVFAISCATDGTTFTSGQRGSQVYSGVGSSVFIWGAQLEAGAFPTSYIPTTTAAATRAADVATMIGANFSNWYNASTGSIFTNYATMQQSGFPSITSASDGTNNNRIQLSHVNAGRRPVVTASGVAQWDTQGGVLGSTTSGVFAKFAMAYEASNYAAVVNGGTPATQSSGSVPVGLNRLAVGADGASANYLNGHISRIAYYNRRLSNAQLQGITS